MKHPPQAFRLESEMLLESRVLARAAHGGLLDFLLAAENDDRAYTVDGGVATLGIDGPLMQKGGWWWEGYDTILEKFSAALADPEVTSVVLKINSPGGVCSGCFSAARSMIDLKKKAGKPVYAFADESAYSAAYALACVADEIYIPREGGVGSVGVIGTLQDWSAFNERQGIKVAVVVSGAHKADGHPDMPLKADVVARYQRRVDELATSFIELVSMARGVTTESIRKLEAACVYGDAAIISNLADGISSFEDVVAKARTSATGSLNQGKNVMTNTTKASASNEVTLTAEDRDFCERFSVDPAKFLAQRTKDLADASARAAYATQSEAASAPSAAIEVVLSADDENAIVTNGIDRAKFIEARREELARKAEVAR
jgi:signal peptide peptidase SppA